MKSHPILFSAPMVRSILEGRKTQTRRIVKPQPEEGAAPRWTYVVSSTDKSLEDKLQCSVLDPDGRSYTDRGRETVVFSGRSPYGQPGDQLWVREAWRTVAGADDIPPRDLMNVESFTHYEADGRNPLGMGKLRPSIHMPRWASRITLEIVSIRVERLQDISEADAIAEGCCALTLANPPTYESAKDVYSILWDQINGAGSWAANPWVWVVEFRRVES